MRTYECGDTTKEERQWFKWLGKCEKILGRSLSNIAHHSFLSDLHADGCDPDEAITEVIAQCEIEKIEAPWANAPMLA
jgi:hypothetical protein